MRTHFPLGVIICAHNSRAGHIGRALQALRAQTLAAQHYELLVVDNASAPPLRTALDLSWHPNSRIVTEPRLGLSWARLCAIEHCAADVLVWVDDDNLLAPDYLETAAALARDWPMLGVWGCGNFIPEWESPPPEAFAPYLKYLAIHRAPGDRWSNQPYDYAAIPAGAGLCCRRTVAHAYARTLREDRRRALLGRNGQTLGACEDIDLALHAIDIGLGTGVFTRLTLTHLMPESRTQEAYLLRLAEGHAASMTLLLALRSPGWSPPRRDWLARVRGWRRFRRLDPVCRRIELAKYKGEAEGLKRFASLAP